MSVTTYNLPDGTEPIGNGTTNTLQYNDTSNPDRLTKCGYKNIGYNAIGYPVTYGSMHFDWENGKLAKYYEEEDPYGIMGYEENGERFLYRKNLFGDITAIYHGSTKVAEYVYDAWGNCTITYDPDGIGARNPFRYRGYYWDNDIQMYYLMTRYYDPKTGRFINADSIEYLEPKEINGLNLYAYCGNNPVMNIDPIGTLDYTAWYGEDGYNPGSDDWFYRNAYGGGYESGYYGSGSAYYNYYVSSNTAAYDAYGGGYYYPGVSSGVANPGYYIVPGATVVTDGMAAPSTITVYRSVSDAEAQDISQTGKFRISPTGMDSKQFGFNYSETSKFGKWAKQNTIVSATLPTHSLSNFDLTRVDTHIFRHGTLTIYSSDMGLFNELTDGTIVIIYK